MLRNVHFTLQIKTGEPWTEFNQGHITVKFSYEVQSSASCLEDDLKEVNNGGRESN